MYEKERSKLITSLTSFGMTKTIQLGEFDGLFSSGGNGEQPHLDNFREHFGVFYYDNGITQQDIPGGIWTTLQNDGAGPGSSREFSPVGLPEILETPSGRIMTENLKLGDEIYVRHTVNIIATVAGTTFAFRHLIGNDTTGFMLPSAPSALLGSAGSSTGNFIIDAHFFLQNENTRVIGAFPQIRASNPVTMKHTASYISVVRT